MKDTSKTISTLTSLLLTSRLTLPSPKSTSASIEQFHPMNTTRRSIRTSLAGLMIVSMLVLFVSPAAAVTISVGGTDYDVSTITTTFDAQSALLLSQPWWGDSLLADTAAADVGSSLGLPNGTGSGPLFAWAENSFPGIVEAVGHFRGMVVDLGPLPNSASVTYAVATPTIPEPSRVILMGMGIAVVALGRRHRPQNPPALFG